MMEKKAILLHHGSVLRRYYQRLETILSASIELIECDKVIALQARLAEKRCTSGFSIVGDADTGEGSARYRVYL
jgi:hypothetical protein